MEEISVPDQLNHTRHSVVPESGSSMRELSMLPSPSVTVCSVHTGSLLVAKEEGEQLPLRFPEMVANRRL